jgi:hypothetical protein
MAKFPLQLSCHAQLLRMGGAPKASDYHTSCGVKSIKTGDHSNPQELVVAGNDIARTLVHIRGAIAMENWEENDEISEEEAKQFMMHNILENQETDYRKQLISENYTWSKRFWQRYGNVRLLCQSVRSENLMKNV